MLAALIVTWRIEGRRGLREIVSRMFLWNIRPIWWIAALSPLVLGLAVALVLNLTMGSQISLAALGEVQFLPPLGMGALLLWILTFGIGEETGWRGFALPRLQYDRNALLATVILWFFWALWHLPAFFYSLDPAIAPGWLIGQFAGAILFTWLFNSCGGSILIIAVWHGCFNFITSSPSVDGLLAAVVSTMVMIWAIIIVMAFKPAKLSSGEKVVI
jgi:membrane protease YdiL (CAAX protease family)